MSSVCGTYGLIQYASSRTIWSTGRQSARKWHSSTRTPRLQLLQRLQQIAKLACYIFGTLTTLPTLLMSGYSTETCKVRPKGEVRLLEAKASRMSISESPESTSHLHCRGWVFQERILSPRILYIGSTQLYWECNDATYYEAIHGPVAGPISISRTTKALPGEESACKRAWNMIISDYSKCYLTHVTDVLPAISGIARHFWLLTGDTYLAGLWQSSLPEALLWHRYVHGKAASKEQAT